MYRRELLAGAGTALCATAGCVSEISQAVSPEVVTVDQPGCPSRTYERIVRPTEEVLTIGYHVVKSSEGWQERISIQNIGDMPVVLDGYTVLFESEQQYSFKELTLIPGAMVELVTYGDPDIFIPDDCPKYTYVRHADLDAPLLRDKETTISLLTPDGEHLFQETLRVS